MEQLNIGQYIKTLRNEQQLTLHQLAKHTDIDMTMLSKIERGGRLPTIKQMKSLAFFFQLNEDAFISRLMAERIVKKYGINENTLVAVQLVEEKITKYLNKGKI